MYIYVYNNNNNCNNIFIGSPGNTCMLRNVKKK